MRGAEASLQALIQSSVKPPPHIMGVPANFLHLPLSSLHRPRASPQNNPVPFSQAANVQDAASLSDLRSLSGSTVQTPQRNNPDHFSQAANMPNTGALSDLRSLSSSTVQIPQRNNPVQFSQASSSGFHWNTGNASAMSSSSSSTFHNSQNDLVRSSQAASNTGSLLDLPSHSQPSGSSFPNSSTFHSQPSGFSFSHPQEPFGLELRGMVPDFSSSTGSVPSSLPSALPYPPPHLHFYPDMETNNNTSLASLSQNGVTYHELTPVSSSRTSEEVALTLSPPPAKRMRRARSPPQGGRPGALRSPGSCSAVKSLSDRNVTSIISADSDALASWNCRDPHIEEIQKARNRQVKAELRKERNKEAARRSNLNKKIERDLLEKKSVDLLETNLQLHTDIDNLRRKLHHIRCVSHGMQHACRVPTAMASCR